MKTIPTTEFQKWCYNNGFVDSVKAVEEYLLHLNPIASGGKRRIFVTGDFHGEIDIQKISSRMWNTGKYLGKNDILFQAGDFGLIFNNIQSASEKYWLDWLESKNFSTYAIMGNHENFPKIREFPIVERFGAKCRKIRTNVYIIEHGEVMEIDGKKFFFFGGASSIDKESRRVGISWWPEEIPNHAEMDNGLDNLAKHNFDFDYIITHTMPKICIDIIDKKYKFDSGKIDPVSRYLEHVLSETKFDKWFCGHFHVDEMVGRVQVLYNQIVEL